MIKSLARRFRPTILDNLEDRAVPSSGVIHAHAQALTAAVSNSTAATTYATKMAQLQSELAAAGTQINAAYASFATSVRAVEASLIPTGTITPIATGVAQAEIAGPINILATSVQAAFRKVTNIGNNGNLIASALNGTPNSLENELFSLIVAASSNGMVNESSLPLLFSAVEGEMSISLNSTSIQGLLAGLGSAGFTPPLTAGATPFSLTAFGTEANASFSTFASSIRTAELDLPTYPRSLIGGNGTIASVTAAGSSAASTLATSLSASLTGTTAQFFVQLQQPEESAALNAFGGLLAATTPPGFVLDTEIPLVYAIGEAAINSTYASVAIQGYLIARIV